MLPTLPVRALPVKDLRAALILELIMLVVAVVAVEQLARMVS
jgi:hypothetical protein